MSALRVSRQSTARQIRQFGTEGVSQHSGPAGIVARRWSIDLGRVHEGDGMVRPVIVAVFLRRLKPGCSYQDFEEAWRAEKGFGVPARVITASSLADPRDVLTVGFVQIDPDELAANSNAVADQEATRHSRIDDVIESTELRAFYEVEGEFDFTAEPRQIGDGSDGSVFAVL